MRTIVSLECQLFELMVDEKYRLIHMFHMSLVLQVTSRWFNLLRSARTLNHLTDGRQAFELEKFVTVQRVAINTHRQRFTTQHTSMMNHGPIAICHSSEEGRFITWTQAGHKLWR
jgi:hypothetical protein